MMDPVIKYDLLSRRLVEVCTDPQRRYYNGCWAKSEMRWTPWASLYYQSKREDAEDSARTYKEINPTHEYKVVEIEKCSACSGTGAQEDGKDCLTCKGRCWIPTKAEELT